MAHVLRILPSITLCIPGDGTVTLNDLQAFIDQSLAIGVPRDKPLPTTMEIPFNYDQRDNDPGSFTIQASPHD